MTTRCWIVLVTASLGFTIAGFAAEDRISQPIESARSRSLPASVLPKVKSAIDRGALAPDTRITQITVVIAPTGAQRADLEKLLEAQRDPSSADYRNWLTPAQYGERFGLSENDVVRISSWLQSEGFTVEQVARGRNWIAFAGTAGQIAQTFHTELHRVEIDGEAHFTNLTPPSIPASLDGVIESIRGLDDFRPKPQRARILSHPELNAPGGVHFLGPGDFATIYDIQALYNAGFDGTGQKLAIAGQTDVSLTDLRAFRAQFNLPARDPQMVLYGVDPGTTGDDQVEASLDLEWSGAVARNATIVYVYSKNVFGSLQYAIDQNLAPVISMSYGGCEMEGSTSYRTLAQQANAQGITWVNASGDSGAAGCDSSGEPVAVEGVAATFPADIPEVTAVGGTELNENGGYYWAPENNANFATALSYIPEKAWNDTASGYGLAAGGGAASLIYAKPWWQNGPGVPNDQARDVPDVSLAASGAHDSYAMYVRGQLVGVGGTSVSSPSFAGMVSILNQYLVAKRAIPTPGLGNINPDLYSLAQNTTGIFHDIVAGNNIVPCTAGSKGCVNGYLGYTAGPGYDLATGLGSVDAFRLITNWTAVPPVTGTTMTLTATPASIAASAGVQLTAALNVTGGSKAPAGTVTFAAVNTILGSATLTGSGSTGTATLVIPGGRLVTGVNVVTAEYPGNATFSNSTASASVSVAAPPPVAPIATSTTVTASPAAISQGASTLLTATVRQATGTSLAAGTVTFMSGITSLGTVNLVASASGAAATLTVSSAVLPAGAGLIAANYTPTGNFAKSSGSFVVTVILSLAATTTTATAIPAAIAASGATQITVNVKPSTVTNVPTGTVTFFDGARTLGAVPLTNGAVTLLVSGASLLPGANSIIAVYAGNGSFSSSTSAPVTVTVASPIVTLTTVLASPATFAQSSSTLVTATVKPASGTAAPAGRVLFGVGNTLLGTVPITPSGTNATATLLVNGSGLAVGANVIVAVYSPTGNFAGSWYSSMVNVTAPSIATTLLLTAAPGAQPLTTVLTATVKALPGSVAPTGYVTFALGTEFLGSAPVFGSGPNSTGTLTLNNGVLAQGGKVVVAAYVPTGAFSGSTTSIAVSGPQ